MKISFWISAVVFYVARVVFSHSIPVGTVLFRTTDLVKKCWTENEKSLLKARLIMQDVLPDPGCLDFSKPEATVILLDYFHACFQIISTSTYGKVQNLMMMALSDTLGGYLKAYVLPFAKRGFYAGNTEYAEAKKLFQLYEDIKCFLRTNGNGWADPHKLCYRNIIIRPLAITSGALEACKELYLIEKTGKLHRFSTNRYRGKVTQKSDEEEKEEDNQTPKEKGNCKLSKKKSQTKNEKSNNEDTTTVQSEVQFDVNITREALQNLQSFDVAPNKTQEDCKVFKSLQELVCQNCSTGNEDQTTASQQKNEDADKPNTPSTGTEEPNNQKNEDPSNKQKNDEIVKKSKVKRDKNSKKVDTYLLGKTVVVPLPVLDDSKRPCTIALPFKKNPLRSLDTGGCVSVLENYYMSVIRCFIARGNTRADIRNFNANFLAWLEAKVLPHLQDDKWYPAFGGVLRIIETMKRFGSELIVKDPLLNDIGFVFSSGVEFKATENPKFSGKDRARDVKDADGLMYTFSNKYFMIAIIIFAMIWLFVFCACVFYCQATKGNRLLFEGYSDECLGYRHETKKPEKFVNLEFLVSFFKKKEKNPVQHMAVAYMKDSEEGRTNAWKKILGNPNLKQGIDDFDSKQKHGKLSKEPQMCKRKTLGQLIVTEQGDIPAFLVNKSELTNQDYNQDYINWPCPYQLGKEQLHKTDRGIKERGDQVQMLWKKPSTEFRKSIASKDGDGKRRTLQQKNWKPINRTTINDLPSKTSTNTETSEEETKASSRKKRSSTCCCEESCRHAPTTTTNSISRYQETTETEEEESYSDESEY